MRVSRIRETIGREDPRAEWRLPMAVSGNPTAQPGSTADRIYSITTPSYQPNQGLHCTMFATTHSPQNVSQRPQPRSLTRTT